MASIENIKASDGTGNANVATVQSSRAPAASTIIVDTVLGINAAGFAGSMGTPHTFTDPVTSETITVISEATAVDFTGHVDGSNLEIDDIAPGYTDAGSEVGDIVIIRPTTQYGNNIADVLETAHADDGSIATDTIAEKTLAAGVTVDGLLIKDNALTTNNSVPGNALATNAIKLGYAASTSNFVTVSTSEVLFTGLTVTVTIPPGGRSIKITAFCAYASNTIATNINYLTIWDGTVGSGTQLSQTLNWISDNNFGHAHTTIAVVTPAAGTKTYNIGVHTTGGSATYNAGTTYPAFILVEAI